MWDSYAAPQLEVRFYTLTTFFKIEKNMKLNIKKIFLIIFGLGALGALGTLISPSKTTYTSTDNKCETITKIDGTIDKRECDLQELCKDKVFFEKKINKAKNFDDLISAQESYKDIILWLGAYKSEDIERVCYGAFPAQPQPQPQPKVEPSQSKDVEGLCNSSPFEIFEVGKTYHINDLAPLLKNNCPGYVTKKNDGLIVQWQKNKYILRIKKPDVTDNENLYIIYQISLL